jgi:hypothetical protein
MTTNVKPIENVLAHLENVEKINNGWRARCPAHDDKRPSLFLNEAADGKVLLKCYAGCDYKKILAAVGLQPRNLFPGNGCSKPSSTKNVWQEVAAYDYVDENGNLLYQVVRKELYVNDEKEKEFPQRRPDGKGGWIPNIKGVQRVLYHLPKVIQARNAGETIYVAEGEKCVEALEAWGLVATTNSGGAGKWCKDSSEYLCGANVVILPDNDPTGHAHVEKIVQSLYGKAASIKIIDLPGLPNKGDIINWRDSGHTLDDLKQIESQTPHYAPVQTSNRPAISENEQVENPSEQQTQVIPWPDPLAPEAFYGFAGDLIETIEPHSEADKAALLFQFLAAFGSCIGRSAHFVAEADKHYMNLFVVMVGRTSKGRKGTSWGRIRHVFEKVDPGWVKDRVQSGLSSGEGLIWAVRDPIMRYQKVDKTSRKGKERDREKEALTAKVFGYVPADSGDSDDYELITSDPGVEDKRLMLIESEFASTLRVLGRDGNTLSPLIRQAWDMGALRALVKNSPAQATDAHISIVGHITRDELRRYLDNTEAGNGFGNRFLWVGAQRSKTLPWGGRLSEADLDSLAQRLCKIVEFARSAGELKPDTDASRAWEVVYGALSEGKPGLLGAVTSRAEAQTLRLASIYALLDLSHRIRVEHLYAALALWKYNEQSARYIFGDSLGDPVTDELLQIIREHPDGITRTRIRDKFGRHKTADQINRALAVLLEHRLAERKFIQTGGRPVEKWFPLGDHAT